MSSGFVVWMNCTQSGGCPELCSADVMTAPDDVKRSIEGSLEDGMTACLLVDCRPSFEVRVIQAGTLAAVIDIYPFLSTTLKGERYRMDPAGVAAMLEVEGGEYADLGEPTWTTTLDWPALHATLPELVPPIAREGTPLGFEDAAGPRELPWGASSPS